MANPLKRPIKQFPALYRFYLAAKNKVLRLLQGPLRAVGIDYMPPADPIAEVRRVRRSSRSGKPGDGPRVLLLSLRGWANHLLWETTLAHALQLRGARCDLVACDHVLPVCDTKIVTDMSPALCDYCGRLARNVPTAFGLRVHRLSTFAPREKLTEMQDRVRSEATLGLADRAVAGLRIGDAIEASLARFTLTGSATSDAPTVAVARRGFLASAEFLATAYETMLDQLRPDRIVMLNGLFLPEQLMMALARERGIEVLTYEQGGYIRNSLVFAWNRPANREMLTEPWSHYRDLPLTEAEEARLDQYVLQRASGAVGSQRLWPEMQADRQAIRAHLALDDRPIVSVFTNILWDTAMYQTQVGFSSMFDWLQVTISELSRRPDLQTVLRVHPAEVRIKNRESRDPVLARFRAAFPDPPQHIHLVGPEETLSSYALIDMSRAVAVYNTTIGVEAALRGVPVALSALAHFRGKGFTTDIESPQQYRDWLRELPGVPPLTPEQTALARRYAYLYFFRFLVPFRFVETHDYGPRLTYQTLDELGPGRDAFLDRICNAILDVSPIAMN
ncbi:MAG: hypothetical protein OEV08_09580 [Nitrospira sp.]|nr:hypothetical protein [Nitrospira sp.]